MLFWVAISLLGFVHSPTDVVAAEDENRISGFYSVTREPYQVYVLNFNADGTVIVTEKNSADKDFKERQKYVIEGDELEIMPIWGTPRISTFEGKRFQRDSEGKYHMSTEDATFVMEKHTYGKPLMHMILLLIGLLLFNHFARLSKWFVWITCVILPIFLTIYVWPVTTQDTQVDTWFHVAKVWSALAGAVFFTAVRFSKLNKYRWAKFIVALILAVNILEAVLRDFELGMGFGGVYHYFNGIAGILCIITLSGWAGIKADDSRWKDMVWPDMTLLWIIAYDVWNWSYICNSIPEHGIMGLIVLLSCTIPAFYKNGLWLQARAYTLSAYMMYIMATTKWASHPNYNILLPDNPTFIIILSLLSLALNGYNAWVHFRMMIKRKAWGFGQEVLTPEEQAAIVASNRPFPYLLNRA